MCVIAVAHDTVPGQRLVLLANRDEFHDRPTDPAQWWDSPRILAGRDRQAGGTWLGLGPGGRLAAVTNVREVPPSTAPRSRGELPVRFLDDGPDAEGFALRSLEQGSDYGGFNLVLFDGRGLAWCSNRHPQARRLDKGIYVVSNHLLDTPWPKSERIRRVLTESADESDWLAVLQDPRPAEDHELPDTGVGLARERMLSPVFIRSETYGTRCSTIITLGHDGEARMLEIDYRRDGQEAGRRQFEFVLAGDRGFG